MLGAWCPIFEPLVCLYTHAFTWGSKQTLQLSSFNPEKRFDCLYFPFFVSCCELKPPFLAFFVAFAIAERFGL